MSQTAAGSGGQGVRRHMPQPVLPPAPAQPALGRLGPGHAGAYAEHLLRLPEEERRLRFYGAAGEEWLRGHARTALGEVSALGHGAWDGPRLRAAALCLALPEGAEIRLSVEPGWQRIGLGRALLARLLADAARAGCRRALLPLEPEAPGLRGFALACGAALTEGGRAAVFALAPPP